MEASNIILAVIGDYYKVTTVPSFLIDHGMQLQISGIDLPEVFEVHFSNSKRTDAKRQLGTNNVVTIPDEYFLSGAAQIYCWLYLHPTQTSGVTEYEIVIPLRQRPGVDPAEPTPEQEDIIEQAIAALNTAVEQTGADVIAAEAAQAAAELAQGKAEDAQAAAELAQEKAEEAQRKTEADLNEKADVIISAASGEMVSFADGAAMPVKELAVAIIPIQDLHGYDSPWAPGKGVNRFFAPNQTASKSGMNLTVTDEEIILTGRSTGGDNFLIPDTYDFYALQPGTYTLSVSGTTGALYPIIQLRRKTGSPTVVEWVNGGRRSVTFTLSEETEVRINLNIGEGNVDVNSDMRIQVQSGSTATTWQPYANVCPIAGRTGLTAYVGPTEDTADATAYAVNWEHDAGTVYAGDYDVVIGDLRVCPYYGSYAGEPLVGPWISSLDKYMPGGIPTLGAQVVDLGGVPTEYEFPAQTPMTLYGQNNVWSDSGPVSIKYRADTKLYIDEKIAQAIAQALNA